MNPFNLKNNALFLSCWYERSRPTQMICLGVMILSVLLLSFLIIFTFDQEIEKNFFSMFYVIAGLQALILLVQGTLFAGHMGARERICQTLDFHRSSPESAFTKIFGLVFGSSWFEWALFFIFFIMELPFVLLKDIQPSQILLYNFSLMISGIFFHTTAVTTALMSKQKKRTSLLGILVLLIFCSGPLFMIIFSRSYAPFFAYLMGASAFQLVFVDPIFQVHRSFYTVELPLIVMQIIVQVPLCLLMMKGMERIFRRPNSPVWSKLSVLSFCGFLFFMITGFFISTYLHIDEILSSNSVFGGMMVSSEEEFLTMEVMQYAGLYVFLGYLVSFFCVPTYFKRSKFVVFRKKGMGPIKAIFDDGATSLYTLMIYIVMGGGFFIPYFVKMDVTPVNALTSFVILSSYFVAFSGFLEFFRLSSFRNKKIFFVTTLLGWWFIIPWMILLIFMKYDSNYILAGWVSPFFGGAYAVSLLVDETLANPLALSIPILIALFMWLLTYKEHLHIKEKTVSEDANYLSSN